MVKDRLYKIWEILKHNWALKLLSLAIAVFFWLLVVQFINPDTTVSISNIRISVDLEDSIPENEGLILTTDYNETLSIRVSGRRDLLAVLNRDRITAYVDLSSANKAGEYSCPIVVDLGGQNVTLEYQSKTHATLYFEESDIKYVEIEADVEGTVPEGYIMETPTYTPANIKVSGPKSVLNQISKAFVSIKNNMMTASTVYNCAYDFVDSEGNIIDKKYLTVDYETINVNVTISRQKEVPINVSIINSSGGNEAKFANVTVNPSTIVIAGNEDVIDAINSIDLASIDVAEMTEDFQNSYPITLPNGVTNVDNVENVDVSVSFGDTLTTSITINNISLTNVPAGVDATVLERSLNVRFRGLAADVSALTSDNVSIVLDLNNKTMPSGRNRVPAYVVFPSELNVGVLGKYYLTVIIP